VRQSGTQSGSMVQRMIARGFEIIVETAEHAAAVMVDPAELAVHGHRSAHDASTIGLGDGLVAEADAEDRHLAICSTNEIEADAGLVRIARTGESTIASGRSRSASCTAISSLRRTSTSAPSSDR